MTPICKGFFSLFYKVKINGIENIPKSGAVIICPNHISNLDPPLVAMAMKNVRPIRFMAKAELFKHKLMASFLYGLGAFPVHRGKGDRQALKTAGEILKNGECLGLFPEGTRKKTDGVQEAFVGAAMFALKHNAQVIPVGIKGEFKLFKPLVVSFGRPVDIDVYRKEKVSSEEAKEAMKVIVKEIDALIQP